MQAAAAAEGPFLDSRGRIVFRSEGGEVRTIADHLPELLHLLRMKVTPVEAQEVDFAEAVLYHYSPDGPFQGGRDGIQRVQEVWATLGCYQRGLLLVLASYGLGEHLAVTVALCRLLSS